MPKNVMLIASGMISNNMIHLTYWKTKQLGPTFGPRGSRLHAGHGSGDNFAPLPPRDGQIER